jgi:peptidyl-prolyl cis-trans isomerase SurA
MMANKIAVWILGLVLAGGPGFAAAQVVEEIVAVVNDDIITLSQFKEYHDSVYSMLRQQFEGEAFDKQYEKTKGELLNTMVTDLLLLQSAKKMQFNVNEQVKAALNNIKQENGIDSDEQFKAALQRQGMDYDQFVKQIEDNLMRQALILSEVDRAIVIDEAEVVRYFREHPQEFVEPEAYKLRGIYLGSENVSPETLEARKQEISGRNTPGADFAALAGELSDSPLKENQGDLGLIERGHLDKTLEQAVENLKPGEVSSWVQAKNGWYLLKLEEKRESRPRTFEEVKKDIEQKLFLEQRAKKLDEYMKRVKEKSYIKVINPNPLGL